MTMFNHVMVDLETLDSRETAVILSIGAVRFSLDEYMLALQEFSVTVNGNSCQQMGLTISFDTVNWWFKQSQEARIAAFNGGSTLAEALTLFNRFVNKVPDTYVWGNGATFDNMILRNAYRACGFESAWSYRHDMCFRTMRTMFPVKWVEDGVRHHALDDARRQARQLITIWRQLHEKV